MERKDMSRAQLEHLRSIAAEGGRTRWEGLSKEERSALARRGAEKANRNLRERYSQDELRERYAARGRKGAASRWRKIEEARAEIEAEARQLADNACAADLF